MVSKQGIVTVERKPVELTAIEVTYEMEVQPLLDFFNKSKGEWLIGWGHDGLDSVEVAGTTVQMPSWLVKDPNGHVAVHSLAAFGQMYRVRETPKAPWSVLPEVASQMFSWPVIAMDPALIDTLIGKPKPATKLTCDNCTHSTSVHCGTGCCTGGCGCKWRVGPNKKPL